MNFDYFDPANHLSFSCVFSLVILLISTENEGMNHSIQYQQMIVLKTVGELNASGIGHLTKLDGIRGAIRCFQSALSLLGRHVQDPLAMAHLPANSSWDSVTAALELHCLVDKSFFIHNAALSFGGFASVEEATAAVLFNLGLCVLECSRAMSASYERQSGSTSSVLHP